MRQRKRLNRFRVFLIGMVVLVGLATALIVYADSIVNTIDNTVDGALEIRTIAAGSSTTVGFYVKTENNVPAGDVNGCNATGADPATVTLSVPTGVTASSTALTFTGCGTENIQYVTFSSSTPGSYTISVASVSGGKLGSLWNTSPAAFTLVVNPPADTTPPAITPNVSGTSGNNGWYVSNVTVSWTVTDPESSFTTSGCDTSYVTSDTTGQTFTCTATSAGGTSSQSVTIKRDATPPTISGTAAPAPVDGWNNTDVTVSFTCSDNLSGVASCGPNVTLSGEGAGQSATGTVVDNAGNSASATVSGINIDKTAPVITPTVSGTSGNNGWYTSDVTVSFTCSDNLSGVVACPDPVTLGEGENQSVSKTIEDLAGNSASVTVEDIDIDKTAPTISAAPTTPPNDNGWYKTNVTIHFTCEDALSGVASCPADITLGAIEGNNLGASGTAYDKAGNSASASVSGIKIDKTAPTASASASPGPNANGWNNTDVTVSFSGSDSLSGIDFCSAAVVLSSEGAGQSASGTCTDKAGNVSASATASNINIDKTAPEVTVTGVSDGATYTLGAVPAAGCSTTDALSGVATVASLSLTGGPVVGTFTATCSGALDYAGNSGSASVTYRVIYNWSGFFRPVDNPPVMNRVKAGSAIPVKFSLSGNQGLSIFAAGYPASSAISCDGLTVIDNIEETVTAGNSSLTYDPLADQYVYVWKTDRSWGGTCRQLTVTLVDGTSHFAFFNFTR